MKQLKNLLSGCIFVIVSFFLVLPFASASQVYAAKVEQVEWRNDLSFDKAFQKALDTARYSKDSNILYKIKVPAGTYRTSSSFNVYSNTYIDLTDVNLIRTAKASVFRFGRGSEVANISGYNGFKNITFHGGTIDGNGKNNPTFTSSLIRFAHAQNVTIENMTLKNVRNSHHMEFAASKNVTIRDCTFSDYYGDATSNDEAVQIEILHKKHFSAYGLYDGTVSCNITVTGCTFKNVQRGVGTHAGVVGSYLRNVKITDNYFENIPGYAIIATNYQNSRIENNKIVNAASGIMFRDMAITYYAPEKKISKIKKINNNSVIANNTIEVKDHRYKNVAYGIQLYGELRTTKKNGVPKGDYRVTGVQITGNTITMKNAGYGIWLNAGCGIKVSKNKVTLSVAKKVSGTSNGVAIRVSGGSKNTINSNKIFNNSKHLNKAKFLGIQLIGKGSGTASKNSFSGFAKAKKIVK